MTFGPVERLAAIRLVEAIDALRACGYPVHVRELDGGCAIVIVDPFKPPRLRLAKVEGVDE